MLDIILLCVRFLQAVTTSLDSSDSYPFGFNDPDMSDRILFLVDPVDGYVRRKMFVPYS